MAQRGNMVFITFEEFADWVKATVKELSLVALLEPLRIHAPLERWDGAVEDLAGAYRVYFTMLPVESGEIASKGLNPAERGCVYIDVPSVKDGALLLVELAARSDWWDEEDKTIKENPVSIQLHGQLSRRLKKLVKRPVWVRNITMPDHPPRLDKSVGYTEGAKVWFRNGGELMQRGVLNIRFEIRD